MNHWKCCAAIILVVANGGVAAQKMSQMQASRRFLDLANQRAAIGRGMTFGERYNEHWQKGMITLAEARKSLAGDWQKLGPSAEQAKVVAGA